MGSGIAILQRQQEIKTEMSGDNFAANGVYGFSADVAPYVPSSAPLSSSDTFSPKAQDELINPSPSTVNIVKGQDNSVFLPKTTGTDVKVTFENGRPNVSLS
jgi:hypothetical protein